MAERTILVQTSKAESSLLWAPGELKKLAKKLPKDLSSILKDQGIETENMEESVSAGLHDLLCNQCSPESQEL